MNRWLAERVCWPVTERLRGRDTMRRFRALLESQRWSAEQFRRWQDARLRVLLAHAARHCPFYAARFRSVGLDPRDPGLGVADLARLPTLSRADVRQYLPQMTWFDCPGGAWPYHTGGSCGEPLHFYVDRFRASADAAARLRARTWWGIRPGDREILLWGAPFELRRQDRLRALRDRLLGQQILNAFDMTDQTMDAYLACIRRSRPACLYGYASSLALLAGHALRRGLVGDPGASDSLRAVFVTGEVLFDHDRETIGRAFGCPVVVEYGSRDGGFTALACPSGRLHVAMENVIVELIDEQGRPVPSGETGEVTVTHLEARALPLIRYRLGDLARWAGSAAAAGEDACTCGLTLEALAEVRGRVTDQIVCRAGGQIRRMHALSVIYVLREAEGLIRFRVVQPSIDRLDVEIVTDDRFTDRTARHILEQLRRRVGEEVAIRLHRREHIPPTPAGKHACVVSHVVP